MTGRSNKRIILLMVPKRLPMRRNRALLTPEYAGTGIEKGAPACSVFIHVGQLAIRF